MANRKERRAAARNKEKNENDGEAIAPDAVLGGGAEGLPPTDPLGGSAPFPDHEEDVLFKTQMKVLNLLLGHWKTGLAIGAVILLGVLAVGEYQSFQTDEQRSFQGQIADIDRRMPERTPAEAFGGLNGGLTAEVKANVEEGARRYETVAGSAEGTAAVMAWIRAGNAWERSGDQEKAKTAYGAAHALGTTGVVGWSAASQYANLQAASGDVDGALATLKSLNGKISGLEAEQAELSVAIVLEDAGRNTESQAAYQAFQTAYPSSVLSAQAVDGLRRLGEAE